MRLMPGSGAMLLGQGDGVVSIDSKVIAQHAGSICPYDDDYHVIYQQIDGARAYLIWYSLDDGTKHLASDLGANYLRAGGGNWLATLVGGVRSNGAYHAGDTYGLDVSPDGYFAVTTWHEQRNIRLYNLDGTLAYPHEIPTYPIRTDASAGPCVRMLTDLRLVWVDAGGSVYAFGLPEFISRPGVPIFWAVPVEHQGVVYVLELTESMLTLRQSDETIGWIVATGEHLFNSDAISRPGGVFVGWSVTAGEFPGDGRVALVDVTRPKVPLVPPDPPIIVPDFPPSSSFLYTDAICDSTHRRDPRSRYWLLLLDETPGVLDLYKYRGIFATADRDPLPDILARWRQYQWPVYLYSDDPTWPSEAEDDAQWLEGHQVTVIRTLSAYPQKPDGVLEPLALTVMRLHRTLLRLISDGHRVSLVAPGYTQSGNWPLQVSLDMWRAAWDLACAFQLMGCWPFAWARGTTDGIAYIDELLDAYGRAQQAVVGHETWPLDPTPPPTSFTPWWAFQESSMSDAQQVLGPDNFVDVGNGDFTVKVDNPLQASYAMLPPAGTVLPGEHGPLVGQNLVLTVTPEGEYQVRPTGTSGDWERCKKSGGFATFRSGGRRFVIPYAD